MLFCIEELSVLSQTFLKHLSDTIRGKGGTRDGVDLRRRIFHLLFHSLGNGCVVVASKQVLALELLLPCLVVLNG